MKFRRGDILIREQSKTIDFKFYMIVAVDKGTDGAKYSLINLWTGNRIASPVEVEDSWKYTVGGITEKELDQMSKGMSSREPFRKATMDEVESFFKQYVEHHKKYEQLNSPVV